MLASAAIITLMYIPVFLTIRGNLLITRSQSDWYGYRFTLRSSAQPFATGSTMSGGSLSQGNDLHGLARKMLWYPIVYLALLLPTAICRFRGLSGSSVPLPVILGSVSLLSSMGFSNACIYFFTRNLGGTLWFSKALVFKQPDMEILVERTTLNEAVPTPRVDSVRVQDRTSQLRRISIPWHIDPTIISPHRSSGDLYPDIELKTEGVEDGPPSHQHKVCTHPQVEASES
jgi:hypothetical protein